MRRWQHEAGRGLGVLPIAAAALFGAILSTGTATAETLPWPKTKPPQRLWQTAIDGSRFERALFDVGADGAAVVAALPDAEDTARQINFTWLDRGGTIRRRASASEQTIGTPLWVALQPDGGILLTTLRLRERSFGKPHIVRLDPGGRVAYDRPTTVQPGGLGGAEFPGFARRPLVSADGGALFVVTLANPAPAYALFLERVDAGGRALWHARFDEGFREGAISHQLIDVRFLGGGETALLYSRGRSFALRRYGKQGAPLGAVSVLGSVPNEREVACGAILDARTIVTLEPTGTADTSQFTLAWYGVGKGKLREQRIVLDRQSPGNCSLFAMDAGGAVLSDAVIGTVRLDAKGAPLWSLSGEFEFRAAPGIVTTAAVAGDGDARRLTLTRYADKAD